MSSKHPLSIYVLWHPAYEQGLSYAQALFSHFNRDIHEPFSRGIGIPVYFRTGQSPVPIPLDQSEKVAIILLIESNMVMCNEWKMYVHTLVDDVGNAQSATIYPVAVTGNALHFTPKLQRTNFVRLYEQTNHAEEVYLLTTLTDALSRLLYETEHHSESPLKLFMSHAKKDGVAIAKCLSDYIQSSTGIKTFFDTHDIPSGSDFQKKIEEHIHDSVFVVIHSDEYASREWCRKEVLLAKEHNRPIVVINLLQEVERRSFPYMGNVKNIRLNESSLTEDTRDQTYNKILMLVVKEILRFKYQELYIRYLHTRYQADESKKLILSRPPELLTLLYAKTKMDYVYVVYPDPPLSDEELNIVVQSHPGVQFITPIMLLLVSQGTGHDYKFLQKSTIGISISESQDIQTHGFEHVHLRDMLVEFARYFLATGAKLAYGGDVRYDATFNFADILFQLALNHSEYMSQPPERIDNYVAYPIYTKIDIKQKADLQQVANLIGVPPPEGVTGEADKYMWARSLTAMREKMNHDIYARVIVGGKTKGYKGKYPGIVEEAYLALQHNKPTYLIGAFGGAARAVIEALQGKTPHELTEEYQYGESGYQEFVEHYNQTASDKQLEPITYSELVRFFNEKGIQGLQNGLSEAENKILFTTSDVMEIISLVLAGLKRIKK